LEKTKEPKLKLILRDHYWLYSSLKNNSANCSIELQSCIEIPSGIRLSHIDSYTTEVDGVWYPDMPVMLWCGGNTLSDRITGE
jgi:hypothetical protein